jgi:hypothetical protein
MLTPVDLKTIATLRVRLKTPIRELFA